jgi:DNA-binding transcriptional MerR regulator
MDPKRHKLLSIGDFVQASRLSRKALRLYDERHLLRPAYTDPDSGYRYYQPDQLVTARLIRELRQIEMPLSIIQQVLEAQPEEREAFVQAHQRAYDAQVVQVRRAIQFVLSNLKNEEQAMSFTVEQKTVPSQLVVSITSRTLVAELDACIRHNLTTLRNFVQAQGGELAGAPLGIYHGAINEEGDGPIEVCWPVKGAFTPSGEVVVRELMGGETAVVNITNDQCQFPAILGAYDAAYDWIQTHGHEIAESPREVWLSRPDEELHMQIVWPYRLSDPA